MAGALFACQFSIGLARTNAAEKEPASTGDANATRAVPAKNTVSIRAASSGSSTGTSGAKTITLALPAESHSETIKVVLNGKDVTAKFSEALCSREFA